MQGSQSSCGPSALANLLRALGLNVSEDWVTKKAKLSSHIGDPHTAQGTIEAQIQRCLSALKIPHLASTTHDPNTAVAALRGQLILGRPALLAVDGDDHWVCAASVLGDRFGIVDSADPELVVFYGPAELAQRWASATDPPCFYAIVVTGLPKNRR